jgi:hypothetical protein
MSTEGISLPPPLGSFNHLLGAGSTTNVSSSTPTSYEKSQKSSEEHIRDPSVPIVVPYNIQHLPTVQFSPEDLKKLALEIESNCVTRMWNQFSDQVHALNDASREARRKVDLEQIRVGLDQLVRSASSHEAAIQGASNPTGIGMSMLGSFAIMASAGGLIAVPGLPSIEGLSKVVATAQLIPIDMKMIWAFLGPALATSVFSPAILGTLLAARGKDQEIDLKDFVKNYGDAIRKLVNNPNFDAISLKLIPPDVMQQLSSLKDKDFQEIFPKMMGIIKLTLLFTALGAYYKFETGHLTGKEIIDLVTDPKKFNLPENDPRLPLIASIQNHLPALKEDVKQYLEKVFEYFEGNPDYEDLFSAVTLFQQSRHMALNTNIKG